MKKLFCILLITPLFMLAIENEKIFSNHAPSNTWKIIDCPGSRLAYHVLYDTDNDGSPDIRVDLLCGGTPGTPAILQLSEIKK